jgi:hypothetical protein
MKGFPFPQRLTKVFLVARTKSTIIGRDAIERNRLLMRKYEARGDKRLPRTATNTCIRRRHCRPWSCYIFWLKRKRKIASVAKPGTRSNKRLLSHVYLYLFILNGSCYHGNTMVMPPQCVKNVGYLRSEIFCPLRDST